MTVFLKTLEHKDMGHMFLVRLHPFTERAEAERFKAQLTETEKLNPTIIIPKKRRRIRSRWTGSGSIVIP